MAADHASTSDWTATQVQAAGAIGARLDRLGSSRAIWTLVVLISCASLFDGYVIFTAAYIAPGLVKSGILTAATPSFFGMTGYASFLAATFAGFLVGTSCVSFVVDKFGRRKVFTWALLWFCVTSGIMAFQSTANGLNLWRFLSGIGIGVEVVTIDAFLSELMPKTSRGKAFAINSSMTFASAPICAALAIWLVPVSPYGVDGWRWLVLIGSLGALAVWPLRLRIPESPRWLATHGRIAEADAVVAALEARVRRDTGRELQPVERSESVAVGDNGAGRFAEIFGRAYLSRTVMLSIFNIFQAIGLYGFLNWAPTLLVQQGISVTRSLGYTFGMSLAVPFGPLVAMLVADRIERKWQIVGVALLMAVAGVAFSEMRDPVLVVATGAVVTLCGPILNFAFHAYQAELYPTRIRARAVGFVYSWSRISGFLSSFVIAATLGGYGVTGVLLLISGSMVAVALSIGLMGPRTSGRSLEALAR